MLQRLPGLLAPATAARWLARLARQPGGSLPLLAHLDPAELLQALPALRPHLAATPQLLASQCWVRRAQPPHGWHQDGALHHDFSAAGSVLAAPLVMSTCWIPLTPCGDDAPGLAWVNAELRVLLPPAALTDAAVRQCFAPAAFEHATLAAGDALLFDGALLHCTHWRPAMRAARTSIELRFVPEGEPAPALRGETLQRWG